MLMRYKNNKTFQGSIGVCVCVNMIKEQRICIYEHCILSFLPFQFHLPQFYCIETIHYYCYKNAKREEFERSRLLLAIDLDFLTATKTLPIQM